MKPLSISSQTFSIRLNEDEHIKALAQAHSVGLSVGRFIKKAVTQDVVIVETQSKKKVDPQLIRQLVALGTNLNQIARTLNMESKKGQISNAMCASLCVALADMAETLEKIQMAYSK